MRLTRQDLSAATEEGVLDADTAERLWRFLAQRDEARPQFRAAHILYYLGGFVAMAAFALFLGQAWESWAGWPMLVLVGSQFVLGLALTHWFLRRNLAIPAGVMLTFALSMVPLAIYSLQQGMGWWPEGGGRVADYHRYIRWHWLFMELGTIAAATVALWRYRMPFTVFLLALSIWYLQMDLVPFLFDTWQERWEMRKLVSMVAGALTLGLAFWVDVRSGRRKDYAFWLYLAGAAAFWGGLTAMNSDSELGKLLYCGINLLLIACGAALRRRVLALFGALGVAAYLGHLADLFTNSLLFPVALGALGIGIVFAGLAWQRNEARITAAMLSVLPAPLRALIERAQA
ncbi:DUF2157 domain-containing protein [Alkalilimnicola sp. S0819]|uniref:DUF2157 domain-containing protein n=1 Tax=Alkalilimnicola sp. S0819 TaxID=2613922 RepID=UPI0012615A4A|nr:DUF2157 domain-containing protein [Alkalilimnicola sp. S0819]KAB7624073.1 DUF2157 domain-containing protein [Alkalilimnicola sp. S0819]MPQ16323.1 DUF2157 domain-containing protein [Alkalilimnicola sp. S0819]